MNNIHACLDQYSKHIYTIGIQIWISTNDIKIYNQKDIYNKNQSIDLKYKSIDLYLGHSLKEN